MYVFSREADYSKPFTVMAEEHPPSPKCEYDSYRLRDSGSCPL